MRMPEIEFLEPTSVAEACALLAEQPDASAPFAGGTDVLVNLRGGTWQRRRLVSLRRIEELYDLGYSDRGGLVVGAMVSVNQVARSEAVAEHYPGIVDAALCLAADQVRNQATVAGNVCMAVPSADMAPILLAHGAAMRVVSPAGERSVPLREFFVAPRETVLEPAEVVVSIDVPAPAPNTGDASLRQGGRVSLSLPMAAVAVVVVMEGALCRQAAVALGAVAPTPIMAFAAGEAVAGKQLSEDVLREAGELAAGAARPIDDLRASKGYRLELIKVLTRRVLAKAAERA